MISRFEWLVEMTDYDDVPQQYVTMIAALGDWIEALLEARSAMTKDGDIAEIMRAAEEKGKDAKRRAIEAGYVWRLDLDPDPDPIPPKECPF